VRLAETPLAGVWLVEPDRIEDERGFFARTYDEALFAARGLAPVGVQCNTSFNAVAGTLRGMHLQRAPHGEPKLIRCTRGAIFDVAVDIRHGSPTFGRWVGLILSAEAWNQILVPAGFAHGFLTLEPDCEVLYKVSAPYSRAHDRSIRFDDPAIGIEWPLGGRSPILSDKDRAAPLLAEAAPAFLHEEKG
jgi:dTDP-4-dehydrorhamnose 3,5-epimerase